MAGYWGYNAMKIKKKLFLGFGLLFIVVLVFGVISVYYISVVSNASNITLKNNYNTLTFTREMRAVLDEHDLPLTPGAAATFDQALKKQEHNITEPGEREATAGVRKAYGLLTGPSAGINWLKEAEKNTRSLLKKIDGLNMRAIVLKNDKIHSTVNRAALYLGGMGLITFFILFILIANFPGFILEPIQELTEGLQEVSQKNYNARLSFKTSDEFAGLADAFNTMTAALGELEKANLTKILAEETRVKVLIEESGDAIIGVDEKQEILFANEAARKILNLGHQQVAGQPVNKLAKNDHLLKTILDNRDPDDPFQMKHDGKMDLFRQKNLEITVPNVKPDFDTLEVAAYPAGTIYVLKKVAR
jgi:NtrC-family two-component system sensor histidine kinase KinB